MRLWDDGSNMKIIYWLKILIYRRSTWAVLVTVAFMIAVLLGISLPKDDNVLVGVIDNGSNYAQSCLVNQGESEFCFVGYSDEGLLQNDVKTGQLECGFIFDEGFDSELEGGRAEGIITCVISPYSLRTEAVKEVLYGIVFSSYSSKLMLEAYEEQFPGSMDHNQLIEDSLVASYQDYAASDKIFNVEYKE